jgi:2-oxoglutarate dehydrogenase E2 component (dihydrolipoamide succinyltransferase)
MSPAVEVRAPAEHTEGTRSQILRWLKTVGEAVTQNEPLIEIETDKVTVEIAAPGSGILCEIVKGEQQEIVPGEVLGRIEARGVLKVPATIAEPVSVAGPDRPADSAATRARQPSAANGPLAGAPVTVTGRAAAQLLSPAVRRLLSENELDPSTIRGTGLGGRITVEDVLAAVAADRAGAPGTDAAVTDFVAAASHLIPHTAVRRRIADHMVRSLLHTAPHVTTVFEADMTAVLAHRARHREELAGQGIPLTLTAYFLRAMVDAVRAVPEANSRWTDAALEIFDSVHIGVGTALEQGGLIVPVLRDAQSRDLFSMAEGLNDLVTRAREGRLTPADMRGGTITVSNHGVSGSLLATPIVINQPQSAILGVGKLEKRPVVVEEGDEDHVVIRPRCYVTLTIDHRVMDGRQANRFLEAFVRRLTHWA